MASCIQKLNAALSQASVSCDWSDKDALNKVKEMIQFSFYKNIRTLLFCAFQTFQACGVTRLVFDTSSENKCEPNSSNSLKLGILKNIHTHVQTYYWNQI